jgi:AraC-like DNA-binding protein
LSELLDAAGIDRAVLASPHERIGAEQFYLLWREMELVSRDANLGLHLGALEHGVPAGHVLFSTMMNSPTVGHALERYCRYHAIMADIVQPTLSERDGGLVLSIEPFAPDVKLHRQHVECILTLSVTAVRYLCDGAFEGEVLFTHPRPDDISEHLRILGPSIRFDQPANEILLARSLMDQNIASADEELLGVLEQYAEKVLARLRPDKTWSATVARLVSTTLCDGKPSLADVARRLAVSTRSLQTKLRDEGTTYQEILDRIRKETAEVYLRDSTLTMGEIAFLLGFAEQSAFNRAFKKWTGDSPSQFRSEPRRKP